MLVRDRHGLPIVSFEFQVIWLDNEEQEMLGMQGPIFSTLQLGAVAHRSEHDSSESREIGRSRRQGHLSHTSPPNAIDDPRK